jgi:sugar-specific transcriptional regulator TrmB
VLLGYFGGEKMSDPSESIDVLMRLGLTYNESKVFIVMWNVGTQSAKTISHHSGIAREVIYKVLKKLQEKGFVEEILSSPKKFRPISKEDAYSRLLHLRETENKFLKKKVQQLLESEQVNNNDSPLKEDAVLFFTKVGDPPRIRNAWLNAQHSVDMVIPWEKFVQWAQYTGDARLSNVIKRTVSLNVITEKETHRQLKSPEFFAPKLRDKLKHVTFMFTEEFPKIEMIIFDKKKLFLSLQQEKYLKDMHWLFSNNSFILELANSYFKNLWSKATEAKVEQPAYS